MFCDIPHFPQDSGLWFVRRYGTGCWELDAMDPNDLRDCVEREIRKLIEPIAWRRCEAVNAAEQESLETILKSWRAPNGSNRV